MPPGSPGLCVGTHANRLFDVVLDVELHDLEAGTEIGSAVDGPQSGRLVRVDRLAELATPALLQHLLNTGYPSTGSDQDQLEVLETTTDSVSQISNKTLQKT